MISVRSCRLDGADTGRYHPLTDHQPKMTAFVLTCCVSERGGFNRGPNDTKKSQQAAIVSHHAALLHRLYSQSFWWPPILDLAHAFHQTEVASLWQAPTLKKNYIVSMYISVLCKTEHEMVTQHAMERGVSPRCAGAPLVMSSCATLRSLSVTDIVLKQLKFQEGCLFDLYVCLYFRT